jgi:hypothetical protein
MGVQPGKVQILLPNDANARGLYCTCWDTPEQIFDWTTGAVLDQTQISALLGKSSVAPISGL